MSTAQLFEVGPGDVALTSDDWYTPRWLFDAAGLTFDLDVCAPVNPAMRTCPAREYLTVVEDGLVQPWHGLVWMNPPYSQSALWVDRWADHSDGLALLPAFPHVRWRAALLHASDAVALLSVDFIRPAGNRGSSPFLTMLAARGAVAVEALSRSAMADPSIRGAYHVRPGYSPQLSS